VIRDTRFHRRRDAQRLVWKNWGQKLKNWEKLKNWKNWGQ
jgi:hypothetical protein